MLRVLQEREFERVGGARPLRVDVRIIATTNRDLASYAAQGHFRQDLFLRLSVIPVSIPPLRERPEDVPLTLLQQDDWPGNVRELQHAVERAVILSTDDVLSPSAFDGQRFGLSPGARVHTGPRNGDIGRGTPQRQRSGRAHLPRGRRGRDATDRPCP